MQKSMDTAAGCTFDVSEANICRWRNDCNSIFSCQATTKCLTGPKKGRYPQEDEAALHFVTETCVKGLPVTRQVMQLKGGEIAKTLGIDETQFKAMRGCCHRFMHQAGLSLRCQTLCCQSFLLTSTRRQW